MMSLSKYQIWMVSIKTKPTREILRLKVIAKIESCVMVRRTNIQWGSYISVLNMKTNTK